MTARDLALVLGLAGALAGCGPERMSPESAANWGRVHEYEESQRHANEAKMVGFIDAYGQRVGKKIGSKTIGHSVVFSGTTTTSKSPFAGGDRVVLERGILTVNLGVVHLYDGEFVYFHPKPGTMTEGAAYVFLGHHEIVGREGSGEFGLFFAENVLVMPNHPATADIYYPADAAFLEAYEKRQQVRVAQYKEDLVRAEEEAREDAERRARNWSFGEALIVGMGSKLLATGNARVDDLTKTGLKYGVRVARDGVSKATDDLVSEQKEKLEGALQRYAERAKTELMRGKAPPPP